MCSSLYAKLAAVLVVILTVIGTIYLTLTLVSTRLYFQELTQRVNRTLAADLVRETPLIANGQVDADALKRVFHRYMAINPNIEVYVLDWKGHILNYSAPPGRVRRDTINVAPIHRLLDHTDSLPIYGDDPRDVNRQKVFSAARLGPATRPEGYLYIVLNGKDVDSVASLLAANYIARSTIGTAVGILLFGVCAGLLLFYYLTRRLARLSSTMNAFQANQWERLPSTAHLDTRSRDEIGQLSAAFKRMAQRIIRQMKTLKKADTLRRELVANVSHDLRTPLASLEGYLETLLLKDTTLSPAERRTYVEIALRQSRQLTRLVDELFELAKLDARDRHVHHEALSLVDLIHDVLMNMQGKADRARVTLATSIPAEVPLVWGDVGLLERVFENLIDNAVRHTPPSGIVTVTLRTEHDSVIVDIHDTGCGIPATDLPSIFDRWYQATTARTHTGVTGGLGLAIAKKILDLHKSPISVNSLLDQGTTFSFPLPLYDATADSRTAPAPISHRLSQKR